MTLLHDVAALVLLLAVIVSGALLWRSGWISRRRRALTAGSPGNFLQAHPGSNWSHAHDIMLVLDEQMRIIEANEKAAAVYGWTIEELLQLTSGDLRDPVSQSSTKDDFARVLSSAGMVFETIHRRKDGTSFPVEVSFQPFKVGDRSYIVSIIRDVTERQVQQKDFEHQRLMFQLISQLNQTFIRVRDRNQIFREICQLLVKVGGFRMTWVGWLNPTTQLIEPIAIEGDDDDYVSGIRISPDPALPEGLGPSGLAFRDGRIHVCNDFLNDPATQPWHERAARSGFQSSIALPFRCEGRVAGLLTVYSRERDFFRSSTVELLEQCSANVSFVLDLLADDDRHRMAVTAVQASERRLQFLITGTSAIIYSLRADGSFATTYLSTNLREVLGYESESARTLEFWRSRVHPDDLAAANAVIADLLSPAGPEAVTREYRFRHANGSWRWMHDETRLVRDAAGRPLELVGYWIDNTERRQMREELKSREEIYSSIVNQAVNAIALIDANTGRFLEFNRAAHEGLGYTREEFGRLQISDIQAEHTPEIIAQNIALIRERGGMSFESLHAHRDGSRRDVCVNARQLHLQGRNCIAAVWDDITESKRQVAALRESETRFRELLEMVPLPLAHADAGGRITFVNQRFQTTFGYTLADVPTLQDWYRLAYPDPAYRAAVVTRWEQSVQAARAVAGEIAPLEYLLTGKDGRVRHVEISGMLMGWDVLAVFHDITERLRVQETLRQLSRTIEQAPLSIAITDLTGAIEYVNPAFLATTGYTRDEVLGQNPRLLKSGEIPPQVYVEMWRTLTRGEVWRGELTNKKKNGEIYHERAVIAPISNETGKVTHYVALKEDITSRKQTDAEFQKLQQIYRVIADNTSDAIWIYDLATQRFTYSSPAILKLRGVTPEEVLSQRLEDVLTPESMAYVAQVLPARLARFAAGDESALNSVDPVDLHHRDGSIINTEISTTLLTDAAGHATQMLGVTHDVTARQRAENALKQFNVELEETVTRRTEELAVRNRQMEALLSAIPDTVMRLRDDGGVIFSQRAQSSPRLAAITPIPQAPPAYQAGVELLASSLDLGRRALAERTTVSAETRVETPGGTLDLELRTAPTGPGEFVVFTRDITARKRLEAETAALLEREHRVSEMKTRFISVTSHEFRTPMTAIMTSVELLANHFDRLAPEKRAQIIERISSSLQRMTSMLDDVLILNRMDAHRTEVRLAAIELDPVVQAIIQEIQTGDRHAHPFELQISGSDSAFVTDPKLFHQILSNLASNAVRYSPAGQPVIIRAHCDQRRLQLVIEDRGIGIPAADHARIFEPFERGSNVGNIKGTGLGLNIVKRMTGLLGGTITLESLDGGGSRFVLTLPLLKLPVPPTPS